MFVQDKIADMLEEVTDYFHQGLEKKNNTFKMVLWAKVLYKSSYT